MVLSILRIGGKIVSGEAIASQVGVSRVAVWKAVQALQNAGYEIESAAGGYSLKRDIPDSLFPWEFGAEESFFEHFTQTESTMTEARRIAEAAACGSTVSARKTPLVITADSQTKGQGQHNRSWTTADGSLACTVLTQKTLAAACAPRMSMAAHIALVNALSQLTGRRFYTRWPNDIWSDTGKVGGILDECSVLGGMCRWINIGIGVNVTASPRLPVSDFCTSNGCTVTRREILSLFLEEFRKTEKLALEDSVDLASLWNALCCDYDKTVQFHRDGKSFVFGGVNGWGWGMFSPVDDCSAADVIPPGTNSYIKTKEGK